MMGNIRQTLAAILPASWVRAVRVRNERRALTAHATVPSGFGHAAPASRERLEQALGADSGEWEGVAALLADLGVADQQAGINPGDQRALYALVSSLRPKSILEVGTHVGFSTLNLALALVASNRNAAGEQRLVTVDVRDVNDLERRPWREFGVAHSPRELAEAAGVAQVIEFVVEESGAFFRDCSTRFDLIFLDGDHAATALYRDLTMAAGVLAEGGLILLHDVYPDLLPMWPEEEIIPGPQLAIERVLAENPEASVVPLRELPWVSKKESHATSLAVGGRRP